MFRVHNSNNFLPMSVDAPNRVTELEDTTLNSAQDGPSSVPASSLPSSSPIVLAQFPLDVLLSILDYLPKSSIISLAMTHKALYNAVHLLFQEGKLAFERQDIVDFIRALQRDSPNTYICAACNKLCPLNPNGTWGDQSHQDCSASSYWAWWDWCSAQRRYSNADIRSLLWHPASREAKLAFMDAYLVMDRHFLGSRYGLPLRNLERHAAFEKYIVLNNDMDFGQIDWDDDDEMARRRQSLNLFNQGVFDQGLGPNEASLWKPWRFSFDYVPKIINDELFIGRFNRIDGPLVSFEQFAALLGSIHLPICHHLEIVSEPYGDILIQHTDEPMNHLYAVIDKETDVLYGSCPDCFADYDFSVKRVEDQQEWSVRLSTYHRLGACRSPYDPKWSRLHHDYSTRVQDSFENLIDLDLFPGGEAERQWYARLDQEFAARNLGSLE
ncbi:hypothetical protein TGAM01_v204052 [Trichoderma gamsii]|uniref:F-box domain-containing protein n=1 Tax=Trichoderma gamsii TaxID=398673 RepID=A0A2P4ZS71_9HYPO|nr:hypothetical protein TGAM01_v204052 [Trichoderma gamsii]PON27103.1 hypothetical protein TGAM01_v204052 [Trichoderma gamsii]